MNNNPITNEIIEQFTQALLSLDHLTVRKILQESIVVEDTTRRVDELILPALERIGEDWE